MGDLPLAHGQDPTLPVGYTTCSQCHRLVFTNHVDIDGLCGSCAVQPEAVKLVPNPVAAPEHEEPVPDDGTPVHAGEPGSSTTMPDGRTRTIDDIPGGTPTPFKRRNRPS